MRPSGPDPEWKENNVPLFLFVYNHIKAAQQSLRHTGLGYLPLTCARSIPFSAASFLASGLANTRPFLGAAVEAATAAGVALGTGAYNNKYKYKNTETENWC